MRKWMNLVEYMGEELTQEDVTEVAYIVSEYVTGGEGASTRKFGEVYDRLPRPPEGMMLHRVLRLTADQMTQYRRDQTFELRPAQYSSWTKCEDAAALLAQTKGEHVIIVSQEFPAWEIVIDIPDFYEEEGMTGGEEYWRYVKPEQEVIVRHLTPVQVSAANSRAFDAGQVAPPKVGDQGFLFDSEDDYEITAVDANQPYANRGIYKVTFSNGFDYNVRSIGNYAGTGQWEVIEHLLHEVQKTN